MGGSGWEDGLGRQFCCAWSSVGLRLHIQMANDNECSLAIRATSEAAVLSCEGVMVG